MIKWFVEYSIGDSGVVGNIFTSFPTSRMSIEYLQEIIKRIALKEYCEVDLVFIDNIAKINSN